MSPADLNDVLVGIVTHTCNPSTREAVAGESLRVQGQLGYSIRLGDACTFNSSTWKADTGGSKFNVILSCMFNEATKLTKLTNQTKTCQGPEEVPQKTTVHVHNQHKHLLSRDGSSLVPHPYCGGEGCIGD